MTDISQPELLRTALFALWRFRRVVLFAAAAVVIATVAVLLFRSATYQSEAKILVGEPRETPATATEDRKDPTFRTMEEMINSEVAILTSAYLRRKVIERLGPEVFAKTRTPPRSILGRIRAALSDAADASGRFVRDLIVRAGLMDPPDPKAEALLIMERGLTAAPLRKANVIELAMRSHSAQASARVLEALIELYLERHNEVHRTPGVYEFFQTQAKDARARLTEVETRLQEFRSRQGLAAVDEQKRLLLSQIADAITSLEKASRELVELEARVRRMRADMGRTAETVTLSEVRQRNPVLDAIEARLMELQLQRERLGTRYQPDSRTVADVDREIERLRELQRNSRSENVSSTTAGQNATYKELERLVLIDEARLVSVRASRDSQQKALAAARERLDQLLGRERQLNELVRDVAMGQADYEIYRKSLESRRIDAQMDRDRIVRVTVIDPPTLPARPAGPSRLLVLAMAPFIGLLLGAGIAVLANTHDSTVWREEDLETLAGIPVLAALEAPGRWWHWKHAAGAPPRGANEIPPLLLPEYRRLAGRLLSDPRNVRAAAIIGAEHGAGATSTLLALGTVLAGEFGTDVILVDVDFDEPAPALSDPAAVAGLADVVEGRAQLESAVRPSGRQRLALLSAGRPQASALQLVESTAFSQCLEQLKARYRLVLLRSSPLSAGPVGRHLASLVDGGVLVVRAAHTRREVIAEAVIQLQPVRDRVIGAVLTSVPPLPPLLQRARGLPA